MTPGHPPSAQMPDRGNGRGQGLYRLPQGVGPLGEGNLEAHVP